MHQCMHARDEFRAAFVNDTVPSVGTYMHLTATAAWNRSNRAPSAAYSRVQRPLRPSLRYTPANVSGPLVQTQRKTFFSSFRECFFSSVAVAVVVVCLMEDLVATHHNFAVDLCNATDKASVERPTVAPPDRSKAHRLLPRAPRGCSPRCFVELSISSSTWSRGLAQNLSASERARNGMCKYPPVRA